MTTLATAIPVQPELRTDKRGLTLLSIAHLFNDANQGSLPAMLPFLILEHGLSLAGAAMLIFAMNLSSSIVQPLFGHWSDRKSTSWVIPVALVCATLGTTGICFSHTFTQMMLCAFFAGAGVAAFHPEGSRFSKYFAGRKMASGMSWFTVGGYGGLAFGPIAIAPLLLIFGLHGAALMLIPSIVMAVVIVFQLPYYERLRTHMHRTRRDGYGTDDWHAFGILTSLVSARSIALIGTSTFLPLFAIHLLHTGKLEGGYALGAMMVFGGIGTIVGGALGDRHSLRRIIAASLAAASIAVTALAISGAYVHSYSLSLAFVALLGLAFGLSAGLLVVLGQMYLPKRIGVASGVTLGLANTVGGIFAPALGLIGDHFGLYTVFLTIAAAALIALGIALLLPQRRLMEQPT